MNEPIGPPRVLEARPRAPDGARDGGDGFVLAHHRLVHLVFHPDQATGLGFLQPGDRDPGPARDDEGDLLLAHHRPPRLPLPLPRLLPRQDRALQLALLVPERRRALEVLVAHRGFLLLVDRLQLGLELGHLRRRHLRADPRPGTRLVDHVDRLVGQEPVGDVALRQPRRGFERDVGDLDAVVILVALAQPLEDLDRLVERRRLHDHRLEAPLQRAVLLDVLPVLVQRRRADALQLAARQGRLEHVGRVDRALGRARPHQRVQLVDEQHDVAVLGDLVHHRLEPLLELPAVLGARDHRRHVQRQHPMVAQRVGAVAGRDQLGEALDDRRLAHPRLADQHRVVLLAPRQHLHHPLDLLLAADGRVQLVLPRQLRQVAAEVVQRRRLGLLLALLRRGGRRGARPGLRRHLAAQQPQHLGARLLEVHARVGQHLRRDALLLAQQAEQQVLGPHVGVVQLPRLGHRQLQHLLRPRRVRQVGAGRGRGLPLLDRVLDLLLHFLEIHLQVGQHRGGDPFTLPDQSQQDVLRAHVLVMQTGRLFTGHLEHFAHAIGEVVAVHSPETSSPPGACRFNPPAPPPPRGPCARTTPSRRAAPGLAGRARRGRRGERVACKSATCSAYIH